MTCYGVIKIKVTKRRMRIVDVEGNLYGEDKPGASERMDEDFNAGRTNIRRTRLLDGRILEDDGVDE